MSSVADRHYERGLVLKKERSYAAAISEFELAVQEDPSHAMAHQELALLFYLTDNERDAEANARRAMELNPALAVAELALCLILASSGRDEAAEQQYRKLLSARRSLMVLNSYAEFLLERERALEAVQHLEEALHIDPEFVPVIRRLAEALSALDRDAEAEQHFERALSLRSDDKYTHYLYGWFLDQFEARESDARRHLMIAASQGETRAAELLAEMRDRRKGEKS